MTALKPQVSLRFLNNLVYYFTEPEAERKRARVTHHFFVASITYRPGKGAEQKRRHKAMEGLHDTVRRNLAPTLADWCGRPFHDLKPQDIDVQLLCAKRASYESPALRVELRLHETSMDQADLIPYSTALSKAFLQFVGSELHALMGQLHAAHITEAHISTWVPFAIGVCMNIEHGRFLRSWGGLFQVEDCLQFNPV